MSGTGVGVVLVAAGQGTRLGADRPKALVPLHGSPVVAHALRSVLGCPDLRAVVVVAPPDHRQEIEQALAPVARPSAVPVTVVAGGAQRSDSVAAGLAALDTELDIVLVHDAARPLTPPEVFSRVVSAVRGGADAVVPALPLADTVKQVDTREVVVATPDRSTLRAVQTPQGFRRPVLQEAHRHAAAGATDDATLVERSGGAVQVVEGHPLAAKITGPEDLVVARRQLRGTAGTRPVLLVLGGLPGVGKTAVARAWARRRGAVHLRIDSLEQALARTGTEVGATGYALAHAVAADQLTAGLDVVVDAVHPVAVSRSAWRDLAGRCGAWCVEVELVCADRATHQQRVELRRPDLEGHRLPDWAAVGRVPWEPWPEAGLRVDTGALTPEQAVARIEELVG